LSFLHGSYVTLTNVGNAEIDRIVDQGLSPQFISVHATDPDLRQRMLGRRVPAVDILARIRQLAEHGIQMHCQVVLCPGLNDGAQLERTVDDLGAFFPAVRSVALVPVGLTRFRAHLPNLEPVTPEHAATYLEYAGKQGDDFAQRFGERIVYAADELFLLGGEPIPAAQYYDGFPQLENGIGMVRSFLDLWQSRRPELADVNQAPRRVGIVTGKLAASFLPQQLADIHLLTGLEVELVVVENDHFGSGITVSGLLTGGDICRTLAGFGGLDMAFLPPNCINGEGVTLDDLTVADISQRAGVPVQVGAYDLARTVVSYLHGTDAAVPREGQHLDEHGHQPGKRE
jgi:putative radical SAM enzyme (TIGR03279 family)